jgi:hypothetical protein
MSAAELRTFMPQHGARMMRLMDAHRRMMGDMKKVSAVVVESA